MGDALLVSLAAVTLVTVLLGILAASFVAELLPKDIVGELAGADSGWRGILLATAIGAAMPTGPMVLFPIAVALQEVGVGVPQIVALVTSWCLLAVHRVIVWELPLMGVNFVVARLAASALFVPLSGFCAGWLMLAVGMR